MKKVLLRLLLYGTPKKGLTFVAGNLARSRLSRWLIPLYLRWYRIDPSEAEKPLPAYATLVEFFSRRLRPGLRPVAGHPRAVVSPVDGVVTARGKVSQGQAVLIKRSTHLIRELLGEASGRFWEGEFIVVYLSPHDYHRIHAPLAASVQKIARVKGAYFPVNSLGTTCIPRLYARNERVVALLQGARGMYALVAVGSTIVGSVKLHGKDVFAKGEELGWFEMGSTVIVVFPKGLVDLCVEAGDLVKAGALIGYEK